MAKIEDIKIINVDGVPTEVETLSEQIKNLVEIYNIFRNDELTAKYDLIKVQSALRDLQREIVTTIKAEQEADAEKLKDEDGDLDTVSTPVETKED